MVSPFLRSILVILLRLLVYDLKTLQTILAKVVWKVKNWFFI